jgi:hypothetical protein
MQFFDPTVDGAMPVTETLGNSYKRVPPTAFVSFVAFCKYLAFFIPLSAGVVAGDR